MLSLGVSRKYTTTALIHLTPSVLTNSKDKNVMWDVEMLQMTTFLRTQMLGGRWVHDFEHPNNTIGVATGPPFKGQWFGGNIFPPFQVRSVAWRQGPTPTDLMGGTCTSRRSTCSKSIPRKKACEPPGVQAFRGPGKKRHPNQPQVGKCQTKQIHQIMF